MSNRTLTITSRIKQRLGASGINRLFSVSWACSIIEHRYLYFPEARLYTTPEASGRKFEDVRFRADDGIDLHGWYIPGHAGRPLILFCHGNAGNIADRVRMIDFLNDLGLSIFIFDYRGYGNSKGRTSEEGTYSDARGALAWLRGRGWTGQQMIFLGRSMGAAVALQMAIEQPPARLVLECPFTSIKSMAQLHYPRLYRLISRFVGARYDNLAKIRLLNVPLLLCHGTGDKIVPVTMGIELFDQARVPKHLLLVEGGGHSDAYIIGNGHYLDLWRDFTDLATGFLDGYESRQTIQV